MKTKLLLAFIILLGFGLRAWQVTRIPAILNRDEAALAYNARLLKETGKDEWGRVWPLTLESFGDYKLPGYPAVLVLCFSLLGYTDLAVKLPSVLAGTSLIYLTYLFTRDVLRLDRRYSLLSAIFIAFQPVFFFYSRVAFEANVALALVVCGLYLLLKTSTHRWQLDVLAVFIWLGAVLTYNTPLLLLPFFIFFLVWWRGWRQTRTWLLPVSGLVVVLAFGLFSLLTLAKQKSGITIFTDETVWKASVDYRLQFHGLAQKILGNKPVFFTRLIVWHYIQTYTPYFVVTHGGAHPWHQLPGYGHLTGTVYLLAMVGIVLSIFTLGGTAVYFYHFLRQRRATVTHLRSVHAHALRMKMPVRLKSVAFVLFCLIITPLPAAVTVDAPHATRSLLFFWSMTLMAVITCFWIHNWLRQYPRSWGKYWVTVIAGLVLFEFGQYSYTYFTQYPQESTQILHGGYDQVIQRLESRSGNSKVAVIDPDGYQYILTAWYAKLSPQTYFATVEKHLPDKIGFRYGYKVGRYRFIISPSDRAEEEKTVLFWQQQGTQGSWQVTTF